MRKFVMGFVALTAISCGRQDNHFSRGAQLGEEWNQPNDPINMGEGYVTDFARLPLSASLDKTPWSDSYWPSVDGGISARWQGGGPIFQPKLRMLRRMSQERIARMSPAEKYDVFIGNYDYDVKNQERRRTMGANAGWEGICHGWAVASMVYEEPDAVTLEGANGIEVPFGASDVKALLSFYIAQVAESPTRMLGERCNENLRRNPAAGQTPACRDTNAGAFHVVLTNMLGLQKKGFIIDRDRSDQVWNQPVWRYEINVEGKGEPSPGAAPGTVEEITVSSHVTYVMEVHPHWRAIGDNAPSFTAEYRYRLELDGSGRIIGGEWLTEVRPDFMWMQQKPEFTGYFAPLKKIYEAAIREN